MAETTQIQCYLFLRHIGKGFLCKSNCGPQTMIEVLGKAKFFFQCASQLCETILKILVKELEQQI